MAQAMSGQHIVVIGAGVFGSWTAHHLHNAGHRVTLVDAGRFAQPGVVRR